MTKARDIANLGDSLINDADDNVALGDGALDSQTTGANNVAIGESALASNTSASNNTAVGYQAGYSNTTGISLAHFGYQAGYSNTTGSENSFFGRSAGYTNSTGSYNTALGRSALALNTTASSNTAVGYQAGYNNTGGFNTFVGERSGQSNTSGTHNAYVGHYSGANTTGSRNTFIGTDSGYLTTTGSKNTIIGAYNGNQGGLDIRTSSNNIVLSDGDGNPRVIVDSSGGMLANTTTRVFSNVVHNFSGASTSGGEATFAILNSSNDSTADASPCLGLHKTRSTTSSSARFIQFYANNVNIPMGGIVGNGSANVQFATISDERLKENITSISGSLEKINNLRPVEFDLISSGEHVPAGFIAQEVETVFPEYVIQNMSNGDDEARKGITGGMSAGFVAHLVQAIKELSAKNDALEARITGLETENTAIKARLDALEAN